MDNDTALVLLADQINTARVAANAIDAAAPQDGVYGDLSDALSRVLTIITGSEQLAADAYEYIVADGYTVADALARATA